MCNVHVQWLLIQTEMTRATRTVTQDDEQKKKNENIWKVDFHWTNKEKKTTNDVRCV